MPIGDIIHTDIESGVAAARGIPQQCGTGIDAQGTRTIEGIHRQRQRARQNLGLTTVGVGRIVKDDLAIANLDHIGGAGDGPIARRLTGGTRSDVDDEIIPRGISEVQRPARDIGIEAAPDGPAEGGGVDGKMAGIKPVCRAALDNHPIIGSGTVPARRTCAQGIHLDGDRIAAAGRVCPAGTAGDQIPVGAGGAGGGGYLPVINGSSAQSEVTDSKISDAGVGRPRRDDAVETNGGGGHDRPASPQHTVGGHRHRT